MFAPIILAIFISVAKTTLVVSAVGVAAAPFFIENEGKTFTEVVNKAEAPTQKETT